MGSTRVRNIVSCTPAFLLALGLFAASTAFAQNSPLTLSPYAAAETEIAATPSAAKSPQAIAEDAWRFQLAIPIWVAGVSGDMTVKGNGLTGGGSAGVDAGEIQMAAALHFEAAKGNWGILAEAIYADYGVEKNLQTGGSADAWIKGLVGELSGFYTVVAPKPGHKGWGAFRADVLAGVRISVLEVGVDLGPVNASESLTIYDPIIGARMELGLTDWLSYKLRGDIGGFGISAWPTSNFSWNIETGFDFHLANWFDLGIGYRWLQYDFINNSSSDNTELDVMLSGPVVTLQFNF